MTIISSSILFTTRKLADGKRSVANWVQSPCLLHFLGVKSNLVCVLWICTMKNKADKLKT